MFQISRIKREDINELISLSRLHYKSSPNYSKFHYDESYMEELFTSIVDADYHCMHDAASVRINDTLAGYLVWSNGSTCFGGNTLATCGLIYCHPDWRGFGFLKEALGYIETVEQGFSDFVIFDADSGNGNDKRIRKLAMHLGYKEHGSQLIKELK